MSIIAKSCLNPKPSRRPLMRYILKALENPLKVVREESCSSGRLRTTSSRRSWSAAFHGSWRHSSSDVNRESGSGSKQGGRISSHGSCGYDFSSSNKRLSNEIVPEPEEFRDVERQYWTFSPTFKFPIKAAVDLCINAESRTGSHPRTILNLIAAHHIEDNVESFLKQKAAAPKQTSCVQKVEAWVFQQWIDCFLMSWNGRKLVGRYWFVGMEQNALPCCHLVSCVT